MPDILFYVLLALALAVVAQLALYISLRRDYARLRHQQIESSQAIDAIGVHHPAEVSRLTEEVAALKPSPLALAGRAQQMNLSRRNQVLRMHLRGDSPTRIAGVLGVGRGEVELLLKLQRTVPPPEAWTRPPAEDPLHKVAEETASAALPAPRPNSAAIYATAGM